MTVRIRRLAKGFTVVAIAAAWGLVMAGAAFAQYPGGSNTPPPSVQGEHFRHGDHLTKTGSDLLLYVIVAIVAIIVGIALRKVNRTRAAHSGD